MVPIAMAAKILYCKEERKREREGKRKREEDKRVRLLINHKIEEKCSQASGAILQITRGFGRWSLPARVG